MKDALRIAFWFVLYKAKSDGGRKHKEGVLYHFKMYPRTFNILIAVLIFSPIIILIEGVRGVYEVFKNTNKIESWSSYEVITDGRKPTKLEMYSIA